MSVCTVQRCGVVCVCGGGGSSLHNSEYKQGFREEFDSVGVF